MLDDQLTIVASGLAKWEPLEVRRVYGDSLNELGVKFQDTLHMWLGDEISPSEALATLQQECPAVDTLSGDLENLAIENGVPSEFLDKYKKSYQSMPSIFDYLK